MGADRTLDPATRAERSAQRIIVGQRRRGILLRVAPALLRTAAVLLLVAAFAAGVEGAAVLAWAALAAAIACMAGALAAGRRAPRRLDADARAQLTVREAWRTLRTDADAPRPHARHAVWAQEGDDGTVRLFRLTREPGAAPGADGGYRVRVAHLRDLDPGDTVAAAEALEEAREAARRDEAAAIEALGLARALRSTTR